MQEDVFLLFADCIPVKGFRSSIICDLGRQLIYKIPNSFYFFKKKYEGLPVSKLDKDYNTQNEKEIIQEYFRFLEENEIIFWCNKEEIFNFPKIKPIWQHFGSVTNCVIDFSNNIDYEMILFDLNENGCLYYQFRIEDLKNLAVEKFIKIINFLKEKCHNFTAFEIISNYHAAIHEDFINTCKQFIHLRKILFYNAPFNSIVNNVIFDVIFKDVTSNFKAGKSSIDKNGFFPNSEFFFESRLRNPYYNGKIVIDKDGNFKNSIESNQTFGNICSVSLTELIKNEDFTEVWYACKDKIAVCKNCEFRYVCLDDRPIFFNYDKSVYMSNIECNYNPITGNWS